MHYHWNHPGSRFFQTLGYPDFDYRLAWNSKSLRYSVEASYHPNRKIDIDTLLLLPGPSDLGKVQIFRDVLAVIESSVQFLRFHKV
jgi:hypothetical protein